jgi:hypothetical protein
VVAVDQETLPREALALKYDRTAAGDGQRQVEDVQRFGRMYTAGRPVTRRWRFGGPAADSHRPQGGDPVLPGNGALVNVDALVAAFEAPGWPLPRWRWASFPSFVFSDPAFRA